MILGFAFVIFTGTIGINVFAHFCKIDGVDYSYIVPPSHSCKMEAEVETCCHQGEDKAISNQPEIKKNCCQEAVSSFKISSDYTQKSTPDLVFNFIAPKSVSCIFFEEIYIASEPFLVSHLTRPPPKTGQEILILNQVFRI